MATLLPNGKQQFTDQNGMPLAGGSVAFYIPNTTTPKDTYQDSGATILNTNPVTLDAAGEAIIFGNGLYRQILYDSAGNLIWDQITADTAVGGLAWGGTSTGSVNAQVIAASSFSQQDGQQISFVAGLTNTGPTTVAPGIGSAGIAVLKDTTSGPISLAGGEIFTGNVVTLVYDATRGVFHFTDQPPTVISPTFIVPTGMVGMYAMSAVPTGWLLCDGSAVSRTVYATLFAAIGTLYGAGNGTTTFNIPDCRGYFPRAWDDSAGIDPGRALGTTQAGAIQSHTHAATVTDPHHAHGFAVPTVLGASGGGENVSSFSTGGTATTAAAATGISVSNASTGGSETRPINLSLMFAIKT